MKNYRIYGIDWDCDTPMDYDLPFETEVMAETEDDAVSVLSDTYGFCVNSVEDIVEI